MSEKDKKSEDWPRNVVMEQGTDLRLALGGMVNGGCLPIYDRPMNLSGKLARKDLLGRISSLLTGKRNRHELSICLWMECSARPYEMVRVVVDLITDTPPSGHVFHSRAFKTAGYGHGQEDKYTASVQFSRDYPVLPGTGNFLGTLTFSWDRHADPGDSMSLLCRVPWISSFDNESVELEVEWE
jgi:hypothetical protein